jgi:hypothetical protein
MLHQAVTRDQALTHLAARLQSWNGLDNTPDLADYEHCDFCGSDIDCFTRVFGTDTTDTSLIIWENIR